MVLTLLRFYAAFHNKSIDLFPHFCYNFSWIVLSKNRINFETNCCKTSNILQQFFCTQNQEGVSEMANRSRTNPVQFYLDDDEQYILDEKFKRSGMKSKSAFLRKLILYGYVYDVDYSCLRNYNTELGRISSSLNQIAKRINSTDHIYQEDMDEVKELMNQVWHTQKSMLSKQPLIKR